MKPCNNCNLLKPDAEYAIDRTREDGLALICRECNAAKCREWHAANKLRKQQYAREYKAVHGHTANIPALEKRQREVKRREEKAASEPDDYQLVRFSKSEWLHVLQEAKQLGIEPQMFVRYLVRDDRDLKARQAAFAHQGERNALIAERFQAGETLNALAREYHLTKQRISEIVHKNVDEPRPAQPRGKSRKQD